jgi:citrate/tricarballylate utilization protein
MPGRDFLDEATRQLGICNACRYCEGYCAVFPALELRTELTEGDVTYLAHLCHDCRNCYDACMFAPPHEFAVNIPALLAEARVRTYARYSWPRLLSSWVRHSGWATGVVTGGGLLAVGALVLGLVGWARVTSPHAGPGAFYAVVPYLAMVIPALILSFYGAGVVTGGALAYWTEIHGSLRDLLDLRALGRAAGEALGQRWFKGGGAGCYYPRRRGSRARGRLHALVVGGFLLAFLSTTLAAVYQDVLGLLPPYPVASLPVLSGLAGGVLLTVGTTGLLWLKLASPRDLTTGAMAALDYSFLVLLDLVALTGLLLLALRGTRLMGPLLTVHLGVLVGFFATAPYGKFVHFAYRYLALVRRSLEEGGTPRAPRAGVRLNEVTVQSGPDAAR